MHLFGRPPACEQQAEGSEGQRRGLGNNDEQEVASQGGRGGILSPLHKIHVEPKYSPRLPLVLLVVAHYYVTFLKSVTRFTHFNSLVRD
jgi:hypothetical protein